MNEFKALSKETWTHIEAGFLMSFVSLVEWRPLWSSN
jgi:hypothetical protein